MIVYNRQQYEGKPAPYRTPDPAADDYDPADPEHVADALHGYAASFRRRGDDLRARAYERAANFIHPPLDAEPPRTCPKCKGTGNHQPLTLTAYDQKRRTWGEVPNDDIYPCSKCQGAGTIEPDAALVECRFALSDAQKWLGEAQKSIDAGCPMTAASCLALAEPQIAWALTALPGGDD